MILSKCKFCLCFKIKNAMTKTIVLAIQKYRNEFAVEIDAKGKLESHFAIRSIYLMIHSQRITSGMTMNLNIGAKLRTETSNKVATKIVAGMETNKFAKIEIKEMFLKYKMVIGIVNSVALIVTDTIENITDSILCA